MDNRIYAFVGFIFGAGIGSAITWFYTKKRYESIANEEIMSVKKVYSEHNKKDYTHKPDLELFSKEILRKDRLAMEQQLKEDPVKKEYDKIINKEKYETFYDGDFDEPIVVPPEEFGELDGYECFSLTYYSDGVLTNELDEELDEDYINTHLGKDALTSFGEYEDDSVFVRNDKLCRYYEILKDLRNYSDVIKDRLDRLSDKNKKPHEVGD